VLGVGCCTAIDGSLMSVGSQHNLMLLSDIRDIFDDLRVDRIPSAELVKRLVDLEDASWGEFRGPHDDQSPRPLSQGRLASMLKAVRNSTAINLAAGAP
jgi:hypothetical protein